MRPGAPDDACDGVDHDCDGDYDEDAEGALVFYADADGDGDPRSPVTGCDASAGAVARDADCDDTLADVRPGGAETCADGIDGDCDGVADGGCGGVVDDAPGTVFVASTAGWF